MKADKSLNLAILYYRDALLVFFYMITVVVCGMCHSNIILCFTCLNESVFKALTSPSDCCTPTGHQSSLQALCLLISFEIHFYFAQKCPAYRTLLINNNNNNWLDYYDDYDFVTI